MMLLQLALIHLSFFISQTASTHLIVEVTESAVQGRNCTVFLNELEVSTNKLFSPKASYLLKKFFLSSGAYW